MRHVGRRDLLLGTCGRWRTRSIALLLALATVPSVAAAADVPGPLREAVNARPALTTLLTDYTFRRSVTNRGDVFDREIHEFLLSHQDIGAALARLGRLGAYRVWRAGPRRFEGTDGDGAFATLTILAEAPGLRVFHARGKQGLRFFPDIAGEALVLLTTRYEDAGNTDLALGQLTLYARLDNRFVGWLLKILIPFIGNVLDEKIAKAFLSESQAINNVLARDPGGVLRRLEDDPALAPDDLAEFRTLLSRALERRTRMITAADRVLPGPSRADRASAPPPGASGEAPAGR